MESFAESATENISIGRVSIRVPRSHNVVISPPGDTPENYGNGKCRWRLSPAAVGMLERVCRSKYELGAVGRLAEVWTEIDNLGRQLRLFQESNGQEAFSAPTVVDPIAQSVLASSAIEGEEVHVQHLPFAVVGRSGLGDRKRDDYEDRVKGSQDLYNAYLWALTEPIPFAGNREMVRSFIEELHRRMFFRTKPGKAGKLKTKPVNVTWSSIVIQTLPPERVPGLLDKLCERLDQQFRIADSTGEYSKLLAVAEFILDFLAIHPFPDGNGRTARLLSTVLLERCGFHFARFYSLDKIIQERQPEYYKALLEAQTNWYSSREDLSGWVHFYLDAVFTQWRRAFDEVLRARRAEDPQFGLFTK